MKDQINRAIDALLGMKAPDEKGRRPSPPSQKDLNRRFVMRVNRKGRAQIEEK